MPPQKHTNKRAARETAGFTLTELLVVIAIIAVLAALCFPLFRSMSQTSDATECTARLRNLAAAGLSWCNENDGDMLDAMYWRSPSDSQKHLSLLPYMGFTQDQLNTDKETPLSCPASFKQVGVNPDWNRGYSINIYACATENGSVVPPYERSPTKLTQIPDPSKKAFFMDGNFLPSKSAERKVGSASTSIPWNATLKTGFFTQHPGDKANVVFFDGHIQAMKADEFPQGNTTEQRLNPFWGALQ